MGRDHVCFIPTHQTDGTKQAQSAKSKSICATICNKWLRHFYHSSWIISFCALYAHFLSHVQLFATPWTVACQALLFMGFSRQEYWSGLPFPPPGDLPNPGIEPKPPALQAGSLPPRHLGSICFLTIINFGTRSPRDSQASSLVFLLRAQCKYSPHYKPMQKAWWLPDNSMMQYWVSCVHQTHGGQTVNIY